MILLDTNVISELFRPEPNPNVMKWMSGHLSSRLYISVITETELRYGFAIMDAGKRRDRLINELEVVLNNDFAGRILPYNRNASIHCANIRAERRRIGRKIQFPDAQIAGIARFWNAVLATRNVRDFECCGIEIVNPWDLRIAQ